MTLKPRSIFILIGSIALVMLIIVGLFMGGGIPSDSDGRAAIDLARREILSNPDVLSRADFESMERAEVGARRYVNFRATYRNDRGEIQNGTIICTVDLQIGTATIKHK
jgi:hypothetical protein